MVAAAPPFKVTTSRRPSRAPIFTTGLAIQMHLRRNGKVRHQPRWTDGLGTPPAGINHQRQAAHQGQRTPAATIPLLSCALHGVCSELYSTSRPLPRPYDSCEHSTPLRRSSLRADHTAAHNNPSRSPGLILPQDHSPHYGSRYAVTAFELSFTLTFPAPHLHVQESANPQPTPMTSRRSTLVLKARILRNTSGSKRS